MDPAPAQPLLPRSGKGACPWNLSGRWAMGHGGEHIQLRHWSWFGDLLWSTSEYQGSQPLLGHLQPDEGDGWLIVARFGSAEDCIGRVESGAVIAWQNNAVWTRVDVQAPMPRRANSAMNSLYSCYSLQSWRMRVVLTCLALTSAAVLCCAFRALASFMVPLIGQFAHWVIGLSWPGWLSGPLRLLGLGLVVYAGIILTVLVTRVGDNVITRPTRPSGTTDCGQCFAEFMLEVLVLIVRAVIFGLLLIVHFGVLVVGLALLLGPPLIMICAILAVIVLLAAVAFEKLWRFVPRMLQMQSMDLSNPGQWPGISALSPDDALYKAAAEAFDASCSTAAHMYPFRLSVEKVYLVTNPALTQSFEQECALMGARDAGRGSDANVNVLYHGTDRLASQKIIMQGFRLPVVAGMFGKAVYFAASPLKSWQYSARKGGYMLACDVALGKCKHVRSAAPRFNPARDLQRSGLAYFFGGRSYDSVQAVPHSEGGSVRVTEYAVYHPQRARPRFLLHVQEVSQS